MQIFSVVFQDFKLFAFPLDKNIAAGEQVDKARLKQVLTKIGLNEFAERLPQKKRTLLYQENGEGVTPSGGEAQKVAIARALYKNAPFVILDEPTVAVDPQSRNKILEGIVELNRRGATILYTSHYMDEVEQICSRIAIIDQGKNLALGTTEELKKLIKKSEIITIDILTLTEEDLAAIRQLPHVYEVSFDQHKLTVLCSGGQHNLIHVLDYLQKKSYSFGYVHSELPSLNDVFLEITGKELRD